MYVVGGVDVFSRATAREVARDDELGCTLVVGAGRCAGAMIGAAWLEFEVGGPVLIAVARLGGPRTDTGALDWSLTDEGVRGVRMYPSVAGWVDRYLGVHTVPEELSE